MLEDDLNNMLAGRSNGANWGLASLLIGCTFIILGPLLLLVAIQMAAYGPVALRMRRADIDLAAFGLYLAVGVGVTAAICSLVFGILGVARHDVPVFDTRGESF